MRAVTDSDDMLLVDSAERVAVVTLNRPERRNAFTWELIQRLGGTMRALDADDDVDVIILTGADPAFCAGVDLKEAGSDGGVFAHAHELPTRGLFDDTVKPVIGAINGATATGGLELALTCDFLIASERARFADTHSRVGVQPGGGVTVRLARWIGVPRAKQMSITGNYVDASTARAWGLVNEVVAHEDLIPRCKQIAADIVGNDQRGLRQIIRTYDLGAATTEEHAWEIERAVSFQWFVAGVDPADVEARRAGVVERGRTQQG
jgi:enoyl-CoA hydratase